MCCLNPGDEVQKLRVGQRRRRPFMLSRTAPKYLTSSKKMHPDIAIGKHSHHQPVPTSATTCSYRASFSRAVVLYISVSVNPRHVSPKHFSQAPHIKLSFACSRRPCDLAFGDTVLNTVGKMLDRFNQLGRKFRRLRRGLLSPRVPRTDRADRSVA